MASYHEPDEELKGGYDSYDNQESRSEAAMHDPAAPELDDEVKDTKKKKKPKWTKKMKQARRDALNTIQPPLTPRNGLDLSPLTKLPGELRNRIYELVLQLWRPLYLNPAYHQRRNQGGRMHRERKHKRARVRNPLAITLVCHQVRAETISIFYSINDFIVFARFWQHGQTSLSKNQTYAMCRSLALARTWINHIGIANARHITRLQVDLGYWDLGIWPDRICEWTWYLKAAQTISKVLLHNKLESEQVCVRLKIAYFVSLPSSQVTKTMRRRARGSCRLSDTQKIVCVLPITRDWGKLEAAIKSACEKTSEQLKEHVGHRSGWPLFPRFVSTSANDGSDANF